MSDMQQIGPEELTLYAMGLLSAEENLAVQARLAQSPELQAELASIQSDLAVLSLSVDEETPAPVARERLMQQVAREKKKVIPMPAAPARKSTPLPWLGWAVAAGFAVASIGLYQSRERLQTTVAEQSAQLKLETAQMATLTADASKARAIMDALTDSSAMRVTLNLPNTKPSPQGRATYVPNKGTLLFAANNLEPLPAAKVYELWVIPANGTAPIPAGTFHPDAHGNANVVLPSIPKGVEAKAFGVTVEPEGGSKTPTLPIIMVGQ